MLTTYTLFQQPAYNHTQHKPPLHPNTSLKTPLINKNKQLRYESLEHEPQQTDSKQEETYERDPTPQEIAALTAFQRDIASVDTPAAKQAWIDVNDVALSIANECLLTRYVNAIEVNLRYTETPSVHQWTAFFSLLPSNISFAKYYHYLVKEFDLHSIEIFAAFILLDRYLQHSKNPQFNKHNANRLFLTSVSITNKNYIDNFIEYTDFCFVGGINTHEFTKLEWEFLKTIDFDVHITIEQYEAFIEKTRINLEQLDLMNCLSQPHEINLSVTQIDIDDMSYEGDPTAKLSVR